MSDTDTPVALPQPPRVRFAPSPTGFVHVGNMRTALYTFLFARKHGGTFIIRIEDTDQQRQIEGALENLLETLAACGIHHDEGPVLGEGDQDDQVVGFVGEHGPYIQSQRLEIYHEYVEKLLEMGKAYPCFCSSERLEQMRRGQQLAKQPPKYDRQCLTLAPEEVLKRMQAGEPHVIRMRVPDGEPIVLHDLVHGEITFDPAVVDDQVLMKSDGFPTYHLANVVDDHLMEITHVTRGDDWLPSTPKHVLLYAMFGWTAPVFVHFPLLLNPDRSKLSKRQGDVSVEDFLADGYLPEALVNFVALLGWNPKTEKELFSMNELIEAFDFSGVHSSGAVFDRSRLDWVNQQYLRTYPDWELLAMAQSFYDEKGLLEAAASVLGSSNKTDEHVIEYVGRAFMLERERLTKLSQVGEETNFLFMKHLSYEPGSLVWKKSTPEDARTYLSAVHELLSARPEGEWESPTQLEHDLIAWIAERGWKNGDVLWPLRMSLTAKAKSPGPFECLWALGKERSLARIAAALESLK